MLRYPKKTKILKCFASEFPLILVGRWSQNLYRRLLCFPSSSLVQLTQYVLPSMSQQQLGVKSVQSHFKSIMFVCIGRVCIGGVLKSATSKITCSLICSLTLFGESNQKNVLNFSNPKVSFSWKCPKIYVFHRIQIF